ASLLSFKKQYLSHQMPFTGQSQSRSSTATNRYHLFSLPLALLIATLLLTLQQGGSVYAQGSTPENNCMGVACVSTAPRLLDIDTGDSALLNGLVGGLLGTEIEVSVLDWQALSDAGVTLGDLQIALGPATPEELLDTPITLGQLLSALGGIGGLTELQAIQILLNAVDGLDATIVLGDLLQLNDTPGAFSDINLNVFELIFGSIQLFNSQNAVTTPEPINID